MNIKVDLYVHNDSDLLLKIARDSECYSQKLDTIVSFLKGIQRKEEAMSVELDALTAQVKASVNRVPPGHPGVHL